MFTPFYKGRTCNFCQPNPERGPPTPSRTLPAPVNKASLKTLVVQCIPSAGLIGLLFGKTYPANLNSFRKFFQFYRARSRLYRGWSLQTTGLSIARNDAALRYCSLLNNCMYHRKRALKGCGIPSRDCIMVWDVLTNWNKPVSEDRKWHQFLSRKKYKSWTRHKLTRSAITRARSWSTMFNFSCRRVS